MAKLSPQFFGEFSFLFPGAVIAPAEREGAGAAGTHAWRRRFFRTEVALLHAIFLIVPRDSVKGTDQLARPAPYARLRTMADRGPLFVADNAPADTGLDTGRLDAVPADGCPGRSLDEGNRDPAGRPLSMREILRIISAQRLHLTGQDAGETHQAALRPKNNRSFHRLLPVNPSSASFSGVGMPVAGSHPLAV
jgi:hypothetical protein